MKSFKQFLIECRLSDLQQQLSIAETPEEIARITKLIQDVETEENKQYK